MARAKKKAARTKSAKKKRGSDYYLTRIQKEHPTVYADYLAGKYASVRQVRQAVGLLKQPVGFDALKRVWETSSPADQDVFRIWSKAPALPATPTAPKKVLPASGTIADPSRRLVKHAREFLACWIFYNSSKPGRVMKEIGFSDMNTSLSAAIKDGQALSQDIIDKLEPWMVKAGFPSMPLPLRS